MPTEDKETVGDSISARRALIYRLEEDKATSTEIFSCRIALFSLENGGEILCNYATVDILFVHVCLCECVYMCILCVCVFDIQN